MPPTEKPISELGFVAFTRGGHRAQATISKQTEHGPLRTSEEEAQADLVLARASASREEYRQCLKQLREAASSAMPMPPAPQRDQEEEAAEEAAEESDEEAPLHLLNFPMDLTSNHPYFNTLLGGGGAGKSSDSSRNINSNIKDSEF